MSLFEDFCTFAAAQVQTGDIDPAYPVLRAVYDAMNADEEQRVWYTFLYVTYYSLKSAHTAWGLLPDARKPERLPILTTGIERRGFRGNGLAQHHIDCFFEITGGQPQHWLHRCAREGGMRGWQTVRRAFETIPYAGTWASYKWADLVANVLQYPITAPDIGVGGKGEHAGPVAGLQRLTGKSARECATSIALQQQVYKQARDAGVPFDGIQQFETALCDFNSLCKGTYYMGHDIDMLQESVQGLPPMFTEARLKTLSRDHLGELNGWNGVRKPLKSLYRDTGVIHL